MGLEFAADVPGNGFMDVTVGKESYKTVNLKF